ncbi:hypothetical protein [Streptomyces sp. 4N124]|uniref:hypothetical protein n=1 Tax=Streptomyces sp. 4N124 TaxID=3457420 RepID=UPI003FD484D7
MSHDAPYRWSLPKSAEGARTLAVVRTTAIQSPTVTARGSETGARAINHLPVLIADTIAEVSA